MKRLTLVLGLFLCMCLSSQAFASGLYVSPKVGGFVALDESNSDFSFGAAIGYRWFKFVALEVDYSRIFSDGDDNNLIGANVIVSAYRQIGSLYGILGVGTAISTAANTDPEAMFRIGAGGHYNLMKFVKPFIQLAYVNIGGDDHFFEPLAGVTLGF